MVLHPVIAPIFLWKPGVDNPTDPTARCAIRVTAGVLKYAGRKKKVHEVTRFVWEAHRSSLASSGGGKVKG